MSHYKHVGDFILQVTTAGKRQDGRTPEQVRPICKYIDWACTSEYAKSAGLAGHVRRKFQMSGEGVYSRQTNVRPEETEQNYTLLDISKVLSYFTKHPK